MKKLHIYRFFSANNHLHGRVLYLFGIMILFWTIFDSLITYIIPIVLTGSNFSKTAMGLIIGSSSIFGALFDILISRYVSDMHYRRLIFWMFLACASVPFLLIIGGSAVIFILAMMTWGIYYDLYNFGTFDFVMRTSSSKEYSSSFGLIEVFKGFSNIIAPLIAGFLIVGALTLKVYAAIYIFLIAGFLMFLTLVVFGKRIEKEHPFKSGSEKPAKKNFLVEVHLWRKITFKIWPVLLMTTFLSMVLSFFWTIGPLYSEVADLGSLNGSFVFAFAFPSLLLGWFVGPLNRFLGKKLTAFWSTLAGCLLLLILFFNFNNGWYGVLTVFGASIFLSLSFPSIAAAYGDYISENSLAQSEVQSIQDFFTNLGFIIGPVSAGVLSDFYGISPAFGYLGLFGVLLMAVLLIVTPKHINIGIKLRDFKDKFLKKKRTVAD